MSTTDVHLQGRRSLQQGFFAMVPGFERCGGCGDALRSLTEAEAEMILIHAADLTTGIPPLLVLQSLARFVEVQVRADSGICACPPPRPPRVEVPSKGWFLYRLWGEADRLLYVGVSRNLRSRLRTHGRRWGDLIVHATWEEHATEAAMLEAELAAIQSEFPAFNSAGC